MYEYLKSYDLEKETIEKSFSSKSSIAFQKNKKFRLSLPKILSNLEAEEQYLYYGLYDGKEKRNPIEIIENEKDPDLSTAPWFSFLEKFKTTDLTEKVTDLTETQEKERFTGNPNYTYYFKEKFNFSKTSQDILKSALGIEENSQKEGYISAKTYLTNLYEDMLEELNKIRKQINFIKDKLLNPLNNIWGKETYIQIKDWRTKLYLDGLVSEESLGEYSNRYYIELKNEWPKIYDMIKGEYKDKEVTTMDYFLDFIDSYSDIGDLSIDSIGKRTKVISNDKINCLFEPDAPMDIILISAGDTNTGEKRAEAIKKNQSFMQVSEDFVNNMASGTYYQNAYDEVKSLLQEHTAYNEAITLTAIPIYHLEPNIRITVEDEESGIGGDYIINRISLPLDTKGNMTINASKAIERY